MKQGVQWTETNYGEQRGSMDRNKLYGEQRGSMDRNKLYGEQRGSMEQTN